MKAPSELRICFAIYLRVTREKMASRFTSVTSEEITQINDEGVPENRKKATKFGLTVIKGNDKLIIIKRLSP